MTYKYKFTEEQIDKVLHEEEYRQKRFQELKEEVKALKKERDQWRERHAKLKEALEYYKDEPYLPGTDIADKALKYDEDYEK